MAKRQVPVKSESKALKQESVRMEERLKELRTMMAKEKAKREKTNGMFWKSGQRGGPLHHKEDPPPHKSSSTLSTKRPARIRVLTDSNIKQEIEQSRVERAALLKAKETPSPEQAARERREGGGSMRHSPPSCGQCEKQRASLFCVECQERYCQCCYNEFHQRGALARHHAQPLSSEQHSSPREVAVAHSASTHTAREGRREGEGHTSPGTGDSGSLLDGTFDEDQSTASFQEALMAWRTSAGSGDKQGEGGGRFREEKGPPPILAAAATQSDTPPSSSHPPVGVPDCTATPSLSYLDKMLIRKHRTDPFLLARQSSAVKPKESTAAQGSGSSDTAEGVVGDGAIPQPSQYNLFNTEDDWIQCDVSEWSKDEDMPMVRCKSSVEIEELVASVGASEVGLVTQVASVGASEVVVATQNQPTNDGDLGNKKDSKDGTARNARSASAALRRAAGRKGGGSKKQSKSSKAKTSASVVPQQATAPESGVNRLVLQSVKQAWDVCRQRQSRAELGTFFLAGMSACEEAIAEDNCHDNHQLLLGDSSKSSAPAFLPSLWDTSTITRMGREEDDTLSLCDSEEEESAEYLRPESVLAMASQLDDQTNKDEDSAADAETLQSLAWELASNATEGGRDTALSVRDEGQEELDFTNEPLHPLEDSLSAAGDELSALGLFNQQSLSLVLDEMDNETNDDCS